MQKDFADVQVVLICGNYNAGKSELAHRVFGAWKRISRGEIRRFLKSMTGHNEPWDARAPLDPALDHLAMHTELQLFRSLLEGGQKVVVDHTAMTRQSRHRYLSEAVRLRKKVGCVFLDAPIQTILDRNRHRAEAERIPEAVLTALHAKRELPDKDEGFAAVRILHE